MDKLNIYQRLLAVQQEAAAPREIKGRFGMARSAEQILEAYKPVCNKHGLYLHTTDEMKQVGDRNYVVTNAIVTNIDNPDEQLMASASAWENDVSVGLDTSQVSGKTSSYSKKYALQNLFAIDDTKDADHTEAPVIAPKMAQTAISKDTQALSESKKELNDMLEAFSYDNNTKKKVFISSVLDKSTIDSVLEAEQVMEQLTKGA